MTDPLTDMWTPDITMHGNRMIRSYTERVAVAFISTFPSPQNGPQHSLMPSEALIAQGRIIAEHNAMIGLRPEALRGLIDACEDMLAEGEYLPLRQALAALRSLQRSRKCAGSYSAGHAPIPTMVRATLNILTPWKRHYSTPGTWGGQ